MLKSKYVEISMDGWPGMIHGFTVILQMTKTDILALESAIYLIMLGHEVLQELGKVEDDEEIRN
ncbi:hypothetical protein BDW42DRAFT_172250 [Aspergillus taichungensis]|uniref:Uncharacterized protein n=1 Tax=Aspergillus taichungensis TaxID=482145 RepID=A0A2J5HR44_9EURO|nr:hypothetical protein BDW42DRAFT_172250 [Aspergillus taichungensis]